MYDEAVDFADPMDCADPSVAAFAVPTGHYFERKPPFPRQMWQTCQLCDIRTPNDAVDGETVTVRFHFPGSIIQEPKTGWKRPSISSVFVHWLKNNTETPARPLRCHPCEAESSFRQGCRSPGATRYLVINIERYRVSASTTQHIMLVCMSLNMLVP